MTRQLSFSLMLALSAGAPSVLKAETFVYVSMAPEQSICILRMDAKTGALTEVDKLKVEGTPGSLAADPTRTHLYASLRSTSELASYRIDRATGKLTPVSKTSLGDRANAAFVATDRTGKYLISASYAAGRVVVHLLDGEGRISESPLQTIETARTAHCVSIDDANRNVFVPHVAPNAVWQFRLDAETGRLSEFGRAPGGEAGAGPRHLAFHPTQKFAFTSDETGSSITMYSHDAEQGLQPVKTLSTLPEGFEERNTTAEVKMHPSGKFVWVSNRGHDSLAGFRFDADSGELEAIGQTPTEPTPRSFDIDPTGRFLYSAGEGNGKLAAYRIDSESGALTRFGTYEIGESLPWISVVQLR